MTQSLYLHKNLVRNHSNLRKAQFCLSSFLLIFTYLYDIVLSNEFEEPKLLSFLESAGTELITKEVDPFDEYLYVLGLIPFFVQKKKS